MTTYYAKAWTRWIVSKPALRLLASMGSSIYSTNKLREAFDAGWTAANAVERSKRLTPRKG